MSGDKPSPVRALQARLLAADRTIVARITIVTDHDIPRVVLLDGAVFLYAGLSIEELVYYQCRPYRADLSVIGS